MPRLRPLVLLLAPGLAFGQAHDHTHHDMTMNPDGIVMNENTDRLPEGCEAISEDVEITVHAGREYASEPGMIFGMSEPEVHVAPCSRVTVTLVNEDDVRHQWMVHGLPKYLYPAGMFHLEAMGGKQMSGTFIVPPEAQNYLVHCDMAQHMEKGMRAQLVVGAGSGDLWAVPKVSDAFHRADYLPGGFGRLVVIVLLVAFLVTIFLVSRRTTGP